MLSTRRESGFARLAPASLLHLNRRFFSRHYRKGKGVVGRLIAPPDNSRSARFHWSIGSAGLRESLGKGPGAERYLPVFMVSRFQKHAGSRDCLHSEAPVLQC
ncbi:hypothetical protein SKAU_G00358420 [Synaphobranchus kaupii]|uniref:Uncharacterized protein n=1 Tax=Synaphobranchus kaupii TaxID=118154 RepID=A0A9Q1EHT9_SYNKA|nr:hypothetical protein SKAU_G00358420 [Synaphobranchus kaupii]